MRLPFSPCGARTGGTDDLRLASYALSLIDTVKVTENGGKVLSEGMKSKDSVMFFMEVRSIPAASARARTHTPLTSQEAEKKPSKSGKPKDAGKPAPRKAAGTAVVKSTLRSENREIDADALNRRKQHQKELAARRHESGLERFGEEGAGGKGNREKQWRRFESYVRHDQLPEQVSNQKARSLDPAAEKQC